MSTEPIRDSFEELETLDRLRDKIVERHTATRWAANEIKFSLHHFDSSEGKHATIAFSINGKPHLATFIPEEAVHGLSPDMGPSYIDARIQDQLQKILRDAIYEALDCKTLSGVWDLATKHLRGGA